MWESSPEEKEILKNIIRFIKEKTDEDTNIYIGADSKNIRGFSITQFVVAVVIHYNGSRGAKMFAVQKKQPVVRSVKQRLMMEAYYAMEVALEMKDNVGKRNLSVHLDLNTSPEHMSSEVTRQASGLISGQGLRFKLKPEAIAATSAADYLSNNPGMIKKINNFN